MRILAPVVALAAVLAAVSCGGSGGGGGATTPVTPTTPTPPANRAPSITSLNFAPSFGVAQLTQFSFNAAATDPDGDAVTFTWNVAGNPFTGTSGTITFSGGGNGTATLTVTDSKGATATDSRTFVVGTMSGNWSFFIPGQGTLLLALTQTSTFVSGTFTVAPGGFGNVSAGTTGRTDPAQPGTINGNANVVIRLKVGVFTDFTMSGTMDPSGQRVTGVVNGSGFSSTPFTMTKQ